MRWFYAAIITLFILVMVLFCIQNLDAVTLTFLSFSVHAPFALVVALSYVAGAATGSGLLAILRRSYAGSRQPVTKTS